MARDSDMETQTWQVRVRGRVQGVGYRYACVQQARVLGLAGWVRNRADGSVEALLQGPREQLERMTAWMRQDVPGARVSGMDVAEVNAAPAFSGFEQRPSA